MVLPSGRCRPILRITVVFEDLIVFIGGREIEICSPDPGKIVSVSNRNTIGGRVLLRGCCTFFGVVIVVLGCREPPTTGVVVESCGRGEAAEVAGLRPGDVVVEWRQGRANGAAESPFHLAIAEQELSPHGPVELVVRRASKRKRVVIPTGRWRVRFQPVLAAPARAAARAAEEAEDNGAFETAAELWRSLAEDSTDTGRALDAAFFHTRCGVALAQAGRGDEASAALSAGTDHLSDRRLLAAYWERAGALFLKAGPAREAAQAFRAAIELLEIHAPDSPGMAHAQVQLCRTNYRACATEISRALEIYRGLGDESLELAGALTVEGTVWYFQGDLDAAEYSYRRALEIVGATAGGSPFEGELLGNLGLVAMKRGDFATARGLFERDMVIAEGIGPRNRTVLTLRQLPRSAGQKNRAL